MKINFSWMAENEAFQSAVHNGEDEKIFHLEITQKEAGYARARVVIQNHGYGLLWPRDKRHACISFDGDLAFKGRLIAMPSNIKGELVALDFIAAPADVEKKKSELCKDIKENGCFDQLFFAHGEPELRELLQAYTALPHWDRTNGDLTLSNIFKGSKHLNLEGRFFRDSLTVNIEQEPLTSVNAELKTQWLQQARGTVEIGHHIKQACPKGYLSSLTGESLERAWWDKNTFKQNGYQVQDSRIKQVKPLSKEFPVASHEFWHMDDKPKKVRFPRTWYDLQLRLGWTYCQKRHETATFCLKQNVQDINGSQRTKSLVFPLATILGRNQHWQPNHTYSRGFQVLHEDQVFQCIRRHTSTEEFNPKKWRLLENHAHVDGQAARAEFFATDRGQKAIAYGLEVAKAHLAASARCIAIGLTADLADLKDITLDHNLTIHDPRLPGGTVKGKVTSYNFTIDGKTGERTATVKLGVAIGTGVSITETMPVEENYAQEQILEENPNLWNEVHNRSPSALCFRIAGDQAPTMGIRRPAMLSEQELVQHIEILNDADQQNRKLAQRQYPHTSDIKGELKAMPTDVRIKLKDLKTYGCLDHQVHVDVLTTWSAPQQINLAAGRNE